MRRGLIIIAIGIFFLLIILFSLSGGLPERFEAPDFSLRDIFNNQEIRLSDYRGRPVVLYFFASW
jgi:hypothetical protein